MAAHIFIVMLDTFFKEIRKKYLKLLPKIDYRHWVYSENYFSKEECEKIIGLGKKLALRDAKVGIPENSALDKVRRTSRVGFLNRNSDTEWIFEKVEYLLHGWNKRIYKFKLIGFSYGLQFTEYGQEGHYIWHQDFGKGPHSRRKLSITVQLSDPKDYEGGNLEFFAALNTKTPNSQGSAIVFPSFEYHRVVPVTKGMRYSLVAWIEGPPFR